MTKAEWLGLWEYNRRMLAYWPVTGGCLPWAEIQRRLDEAAPVVAAGVLADGWRLPPRRLRALPLSRC